MALRRAHPRRGALSEAQYFTPDKVDSRDGYRPRAPVCARVAALGHAHPAERGRALPGPARALARPAQGRGRGDVPGLPGPVLPVAADDVRPARVWVEERGRAARAREAGDAP